VELPPYRFPTAYQIAMARLVEYSIPAPRHQFIIAGVVLVWLLTHLPLSAAPPAAIRWPGMTAGSCNPSRAHRHATSKLTIRADLRFRRRRSSSVRSR